VFKLEVLFWHLTAGIEETIQNVSQKNGFPGPYSAMESPNLEQQKHDRVEEDPLTLHGPMIHQPTTTSY
jgi:hypothetical protein